MAVEFKITFDEDPKLTLDLSTLSFIGITDHNQMTNRDMAEQHPVSAIEGLSERLITLANADNELSDELLEQDETIEGMISHLNEIDEFDGNVTELLQEHAEKLSTLEQLADNVADIATVEGVLTNAG